MERRIALIGFGEAGQAFAGLTARVAGYDRQTDDPALRSTNLSHFAAAGVEAGDSAAAVLGSADAVLSLVTADQALPAAKRADGLRAIGFTAVTPIEGPVGVASSIKTIRSVMAKGLGFERNLLVQATCDGTDNAAMVDTLVHSSGKARGVATVGANVMQKAGVRELLRAREFIAALHEGHEANSSAQQARPCYRVLGQLELQLASTVA